MGAPAGLRRQRHHGLQRPLQAGEPVEARRVGHPQALEQTRGQLAPEGAGQRQTQPGHARTDGEETGVVIVMHSICAGRSLEIIKQ